MAILMGNMIINIKVQRYFGTILTYPCGRIFLRRLLLLLINNLVEPRLFSKKCCTSGTKYHIFWQKHSTLPINTALILGMDAALFHETRCFLMLKFCIFWTKLGLVQERPLFLQNFTRYCLLTAGKVRLAIFFWDEFERIFNGIIPYMFVPPCASHVFIHGFPFVLICTCIPLFI
jgi:hypothetical protein